MRILVDHSGCSRGVGSHNRLDDGDQESLGFCDRDRGIHQLDGTRRTSIFNANPVMCAEENVVLGHVLEKHDRMKTSRM
jgi:hypothetical protein